VSRNRKIVAAVLIGVAALVYGISPFDLVPEAILGPLGLLDDAGVLIGAGIWIFNILKGKPKL